MRNGVLKSNRDDKCLPGFPAFELDGKWEHDSIGAMLSVGSACWTHDAKTSNGRLVIQFRNKRADKIHDFAVAAEYFECTDK